MYVFMCNVSILAYTETFTLDLKNFSIRPYKNNTVRVIVLCYIFEKNCVATYDHYGQACIRTHIEALALTHSFAYIHTHIYIYSRMLVVTHSHATRQAFLISICTSVNFSMYNWTMQFRMGFTPNNKKTYLEITQTDVECTIVIHNISHSHVHLSLSQSSISLPFSFFPSLSLTVALLLQSLLHTHT